MSRVRKEKASVIAEKDVVFAVTAADSGKANDYRKKEATEPLYLKRI